MTGCLPNCSDVLTLCPTCSSSRYGSDSGGPVKFFGSPAAMHLFCKVKLVEQQAKLPPAQVRVSAITAIPWEQEGGLCMAVPPQNRRL